MATNRFCVAPEKRAAVATALIAVFHLIAVNPVEMKAPSYANALLRLLHVVRCVPAIRQPEVTQVKKSPSRSPREISLCDLHGRLERFVFHSDRKTELCSYDARKHWSNVVIFWRNDIG